VAWRQSPKYLQQKRGKGGAIARTAGLDEKRESKSSESVPEEAKGKVDLLKMTCRE
jgi:hypothetical protein